MSIFDLASLEQIRLATGVSEQELPNSELEASGIEFDLELEVSEWLPAALSLQSIYTSGSDPSATQEEKLLMYAMSAYLKYSGAYLLFHNGVIRFPRKIADSNNAIERTNWKDEDLLRNLLALRNKYKAQFLDIYNEPAAAANTIFAGISSPDFNPVTG